MTPFRFYVEALPGSGSYFVDRGAEDEEAIPIMLPLLRAAMLIADMVHHRDPDGESIVEIGSSGNGLAMNGLLMAYGVNTVVAHGFPDDRDDE